MSQATDPAIAQLREQLSGTSGPQYWRSLEELAETDVFRELVARRYPAHLSFWDEPASRRKFLKLMGASLALAGLQGCWRDPEETIVPYVRQPERIVPGKPLEFATARILDGYASGLLVESHMGRPTKIEGNPEHPASLGATDLFAQASLLGLYDPDRSQTVYNAAQISTWNAFLTDLKPRLEAQRGKQGQGLAILTESVTSPTQAAQFEQLREMYPAARRFQYQAIGDDQARAGLRQALGRDVAVRFDFSRADVILSLDADFLCSGPASVRYARDFMGKRQPPEDPQSEWSMNRLYMAECSVTGTGSKADHRLPTSPRGVELLARKVAAGLGVSVDAPAAVPDAPPHVVAAIIDDLKQAGERAVVVAGPWQSPLVHRLAAAINDALGSAGTVVEYTEPVVLEPVDQTGSLLELTAAMRDGQVEMLFIIGGNPVYQSPVDVGFAAALDKVPYRAHLALYHDETSALCHWHLPAVHDLETWTDARAYDGTVTILQPLIAPLYGGKSVHELLTVLVDKAGPSTYDLVRASWRERRKELDDDAFDDWWQTCLHDGVVPETRHRVIDAPLAEGALANMPKLSIVPASDALSLVLRPDPSLWDGQFANNGWLQETPRPLTKLTWDNAALVSPSLAERRKLHTGQVVELTVGQRKLAVPVLIVPGHPQECVTLHLGYGRKRAGQVGQGVGFNAYKLRRSDAMWFAPNTLLQPTGEEHALATTQHHFLMEGRHLVQSGTLAEFEEHPEHPAFMAGGHGTGEAASLYPEVPYDGYKWGMSVNLSACVGCNACVVACQAENNIPTVGKEQVAVGREMHWLRIDTYYEGPAEAPQSHHQPVMCMHCENAPCELVCPVAATTHSDEGINEMTYNRCVGTRYCANNCPYKVRRFNYFHFTLPVVEHDSLKLMQNPDVTVRARGVMEKCTYCTQRISQARIEAEKADGTIPAGGVQTACQQSCPTGAIVFGNLNNDQDRVHKLADHPLEYGLLDELNTRPRTRYLASIRNPNPALEPVDRKATASAPSAH